MAETSMTTQLKYAGKGYIDYKMQPVNTVAELKEKMKKTSELKLGLVVTVLNENGDNVPSDYWYYYPYNPETETFDKTKPANWYPKIYPGTGIEENFWEDGGEPGAADYEAWKYGGLE
jgi:hypothetical protein